MRREEGCSQTKREAACAPPSRLAHEAVVTADRPTLGSSWEPSPPGASLVVLAGRATRVP
jgi:hypothetical protein